MKLEKYTNLIIKCQLTLLVGVLVLIEGLLVYNMIDLVSSASLDSEVNHKERVYSEDAQDMYPRYIDGVLVELSKANFYPVSVMIDNHFDSWPNFGLSEANVVYEIPVEGSATRFLAIYTPEPYDYSNQISKIGPVRSTRPYFVELAAEYKALHAHSGGSPEGLSRIKELDVPDLEEITWWGPDYYWRVYSRSAPHNLFTSSDNLATGSVDWDLVSKVPTYASWPFGENYDYNNSEKVYDKVNDILIEFSSSETYDAGYSYDSEKQKYLRLQGDEAHIDGLNSEQIAVSNVVIQFVPKAIILDREGRKKIDITGSGDVWIFRDGLIIKGVWEKPDFKSRTKFYDEDGKLIPLRPGNTWVEVVDTKEKVSLK
jgi:hypothetical protein